MYNWKFSLMTKVAGAAAAVAITAGVTIAQIHAAGEDPNIIYILADDFGYGDSRMTHSFLGYSPSEQDPKTPNIKSIADEGVLFTQAYSQCPVCCPSRASILTGKLPASFGFDNNSSGRTNPNDMPAPTVARLLQNDGYAAKAVGKWDLAGADWNLTNQDTAAGDFNNNMPIKRGFTRYFGFPGGMNSYYGHPAPAGAKILLDNGTVFTGPGDFSTNHDGRNIIRYNISNNNYEKIDDKSYTAKLFTDEAVEFINNNQNQKFFLYLAYNSTHTPLMVPEEYYSRFAAGTGRYIADTKKRFYAAMVEALDAQIGRVLDAVAALPLEKRQNTMIIFASDNGPTGQGNTGQYSNPNNNNSELKGGKYTLFEGGIRVPLAIKWPNGGYSGGSEFGTTVGLHDLVPTMCRAAGYSTSDVDGYGFAGKNITPYVNGTYTGPIHDYLFWRYVADHDAATMSDIWTAALGGDYKYISVKDSDGSLKNEYLFDVMNDKFEFNNRISDPALADTITNLRNALNNWNGTNPPASRPSVVEED